MSLIKLFISVMLVLMVIALSCCISNIHLVILAVLQLSDKQGEILYTNSNEVSYTKGVYLDEAGQTQSKQPRGKYKTRLKYFYNKAKMSPTTRAYCLNVSGRLL